AARLLELLQALPAAQREAFVLQHEAGMSVEDIAVVTGVTRETAKSRLRYAMAKLREGMQGWL
ncbi:MAG: sigma-70 family RNA polymerase sigma factor, partial [Burkholderiales bacterium]